MLTACKKTFQTCIVFIIAIHFSLTAEAEIKKIKIGGAFALTGTAKSFGTCELNASKLAIDDFNAENEGKINVEMVVEDTASSNSKTLAAVSKLINLKGVKNILGPTWLDSFSSPFPLGKQKGILLFSPSASIEAFEGNPHFYDLVFSTYFSSAKEVEGVLSYLKDTGRTKICTFFQDDPYISMINRLTLARAAEFGLTIEKQVQPAADTSEYKSDLLKLSGTECGSLFYIVNGENQAFNLMKQVKELKLGKELFSYSGIDAFVGNPIFKDIAEGTYYVKPDKDTVDFNSRYEREFKIAPEYIASNAYDAASILLKAFKQGLTEPKDIAGYFRNNYFDTLTFGKVKFSGSGDVNAGNFEMYQVREGKAVRAN